MWEGAGVAVARVLSGGRSTWPTCEQPGAAHQTQRCIYLGKTGKEMLAIDAREGFGQERTWGWYLSCRAADGMWGCI
jgi:hypothetical protein